MTVCVWNRKYAPPPWHLSFLSLSPDPKAAEQKTLWCVPFPWENKGKIHHGSRKGVYTIEGSKPEEKEGFHGGGVYFSLPSSVSGIEVSSPWSVLFLLCSAVLRNLGWMLLWTIGQEGKGQGMLSAILFADFSFRIPDDFCSTKQLFLVSYRCPKNVFLHSNELLS